jgi:general secretion pathway protein C
LLDSPEKVARFLQIRPVADQYGLKGYRLTPGHSPELFTQMGLKPNDIAVEINGLDLTDHRLLQEALASLAGASSATMTIERDGQRQELTFVLGE